MKKTDSDKLVAGLQLTTAVLLLSKEVLSMLFYVKSISFSNLSELFLILSILHNAVR